MAVNIHIENLNVTPDVFSSVVKDQLDSGADPEVLRDLGYGGVPDQVEPTEPLTPEAEEAQLELMVERYTEAEVKLTARGNFLRNVVRHSDEARRLEGFQTNHRRRPKNIDQVSNKQHAEIKMADESLQRACGSCVLRPNCAIAGNIEKWLDVHPYKDKPAGSRRPGSLRVPQTESRTDFLKALRDNPAAHCEPQKRK